MIIDWTMIPSEITPLILQLASYQSYETNKLSLAPFQLDRNSMSALTPENLATLLTRIHVFEKALVCAARGLEHGNKKFSHAFEILFESYSDELFPCSTHELYKLLGQNGCSIAAIRVFRNDLDKDFQNSLQRRSVTDTLDALNWRWMNWIRELETMVLGRLLQMMHSRKCGMRTQKAM